MEPNVAQNPGAFPRVLFSLLALSVGLFVATYAVPVHAQDAVDPDGCMTDATVHDDGDAMNGSGEDSVAVGCGSSVVQTHTTTGTDAVTQPLFTLDAGDDGMVNDYLVMVDCTSSSMGICEGRTGNQLVSIGQTLYDRLQNAGEMPLTAEEMGMLSAALSDDANVRPLGDITAGVNRLTNANAEVMRAGATTMNEVGGGTAVGSGAAVKADGGVAIGMGATVGSDMETTVTLTMDDELGVLVVGYEETMSGGGGDNGIAIGNGAKAMGEGSIAIGAGAMAMEDGQVMIGDHDIGEMASDVASNAAGIETNAGAIATNASGIAANGRMIRTNRDRLNDHDIQLDELDDRVMAHGATLAEHDGRLEAHGERLDENRGMINANAGKIDNNAERIDENRGMINGNTSMIGNNASRINANRGMIGENTQMLGVHASMIGNNEMRLDNHATALTNLDGRLVAHGATLAAHDSRLDAHDQVLMGHAAGINNNAMEIQMLDERVSQVAAASAALSAVPNAPDMDEQFFVGVGVGSHGGESSFAAGISGRLGANKNIVVNAGIANSGSGTSVRAGVGFSF